MDKPVTRTVSVNDLTPQELAALFCQLCNDEQAEFFAAVADESKDWPGTGWDGQAMAIVEKLDSAGRFVLSALAAHMGFAK